MNYISDRAERRAGLLRGLGAAVRRARAEVGLSRRALAGRAQVSERFLAELEQGAGNISVARLEDVAEALETTGAALLARASEPPRVRRTVALLGLRGAGKSTVGALVARDLGLPFVELDARIAAEAGMTLSTLFEIHGEATFRRLERAVLARLLEERPAVIATGGSIVNDRATYALLRRRSCTVWLRARARDHWDRVVAQGDARPMKNRANAMGELEALLRTRAALYARAAHVVDTAELSVEEAASAVLAAVAVDAESLHK